MIDGVVDRGQLRDLLAVLLDLLGAQYRITTRRKRAVTEAEPPRPEAWHSVQLARHESRPTAVDYIGRVVTNFVELHGDRAHGDDPAVVVGLGHLGGQTVVVVGQERGRTDEAVDRNDGRTSPEGFRKAQRAIRLASKFRLPLLTLIDTPGPFQSLDAEERGLGNSIARTMSEMAALESPSIAVVIGEGGSEGALALGVANRVLIMENAIYSVISPEDAAGLIYQDQDRAEEVAASLKLTAQDCREMGIVDVVVQEPPGGAHRNPDEAARQLRRVLLQELAQLQTVSSRRLLSERYRKFRKMGEYSSQLQGGGQPRGKLAAGAGGHRRSPHRAPRESPGPTLRTRRRRWSKPAEATWPRPSKRPARLLGGNLAERIRPLHRIAPLESLISRESRR